MMISTRFFSCCQLYIAAISGQCQHVIWTQRVTIEWKCHRCGHVVGHFHSIVTMLIVSLTHPNIDHMRKIFDRPQD